ncbi:cell division control protein 2 homolog [Strongylocentrotus purpuratus]|uniref:Protein kinase domain-containing protein n=1 Tax=Strongylocentrotus purpuratus TaxID=7668 RepID=A0A7M7PPT3_STRPU|nr:cell division control protein 2 homolog [Strongylocentrotus purpuratus]
MCKKLVSIRKVALRMLQILGFLGQQNVIHADLKPENILCNSENISDGIKVIDFGNAIHGVYEELSLYYDEFELQTLLYRAPEVSLILLHHSFIILMMVPEIFQTARDISGCPRYFRLPEIFQAVRDISDCPRYFRLPEIFQTAQDISGCPRYFRLPKIFQAARDISGCPRYFRLPEIFQAA